MTDILTNLFFWIFIVSLIGGYFMLRAANNFRDQASLADYPERPEKFILRARIFYSLFVVFLLVMVASLSVIVFQVLQVARPRAVSLTATPTPAPPAVETEIPPTTPPAVVTATPSPSRTPTPTPTPTEPAVATAVIGNTNFRGVNFREAPSLEGAVLEKLINGTEVLVIDVPIVEADDYSWQQIQLQDGTVGWIVGRYLIFPVDP